MRTMCVFREKNKETIQISEHLKYDEKVIMRQSRASGENKSNHRVFRVRKIFSFR